MIQGMDKDAIRAFKLELANAEADYLEAKRRHERSLAARIRTAGFNEEHSEHKSALIDESVESDDSFATMHELREAEIKLKELRQKAAELLGDDEVERR